MINFQEIINNSLLKKNKEEKREITSWHISKLGSCLRGIYLERLGVKPDKDIDDRTLRIFDIGKKVEDWIVELVGKEEGIKIETQIRVEDDRLGITGYVDLSVEQNGIKELYEIKSKHSRSFWWMDKKGQGPMRQHEHQLWTYLYLTGIKKGSIIYVSKDDMCILQYPVFLNNKQLKKEVMEQLELLNKAWDKKDISILPLPEKGSWQEKFCRYHSKCIEA